MMDPLNELPVAVIGAGPVGLAAAAHLLDRALPVKVYEAGAAVGNNVRDWGHVRVFTPWRYCVDVTAMKFLERHGWHLPAADAFPTGNDLVRDYLEPLATIPEFTNVVETGAHVSAISRQGIDKVVSRDRETRPFILRVETINGARRDWARAVIDASGTWQTPNPLGADGLPAEGEAEFSDRIFYGIPDIRGRFRSLYAGMTTLVVGSGHSAINAVMDLVALGQEEPGTASIWTARSTDLIRIYGGKDADQLPARGELGAYVKQLVESGGINLITGFGISAIGTVVGRMVVEGETANGTRSIGPVDRIIAATGQRPDLLLTRELRLELDPWLESAKALGPMIDPNLHSCGSVPPHGYSELSHPEPGFYTVGIKSYGRAPTFLVLTGYEQVRSVAAALAGDMRAAGNVQLVLPETGVCTTQVLASESALASCCSGSTSVRAGACCVADVDANGLRVRGSGEIT